MGRPHSDGTGAVVDYSKGHRWLVASIVMLYHSVDLASCGLCQASYNLIDVQIKPERAHSGQDSHELTIALQPAGPFQLQPHIGESQINQGYPGNEKVPRNHSPLCPVNHADHTYARAVPLSYSHYLSPSVWMPVPITRVVVVKRR